MKLKEFIIESALIETRTYIALELFENVNDYLALVLGKLKNKKTAELFKTGDPNAIDLDHLAMIIAGLKIIANPDYRAGLTKADIGMEPNDAKQLFNLLNQVDKQGKDPMEVANVFKAICKLAPNAVKKQRATLDLLKTGDDAERQHEVQELSKFQIKVGQVFGKIKTAAVGTRGVDVPDLGEA